MQNVRLFMALDTKEMRVGEAGGEVKRTVRVWALVGPRGNVLNVGLVRSETVRSLGEYGGRYIIPCTITYDDGTKPKRRRKK